MRSATVTRKVGLTTCAILVCSALDAGQVTEPGMGPGSGSVGIGGSRTTPDRPGPVPPPDLQGFPATTAPNELATVVLPNNFSDVTALFDRLPPEVAGHTRSPQFDRSLPSVQLSAMARTGG